MTRHIYAILLVPVGLWACLGAPGCSDDSGGSGADAALDGGLDGAADSGPDAATGTLSVLVTERTRDATDPPSAGATVAQGPDWSFMVVPDSPLTLVGLELSEGPQPPSGRGFTYTFHQWTVLDHGGVSAPTTINLDFASSFDSTNVVSGSFDLPTRADSPLRTDTRAFVKVTTQSSRTNAILGLPLAIDISADENSFEYDVEWIEPANVTNPLTLYYVREPWGLYAAWAMIPGYPVSGPQNFDLLDLPRLISPPDTSTQHGLHDPLEWELLDTDVSISVAIFRSGTVLWQVFPPKDASTARMCTQRDKHGCWRNDCIQRSSGFRPTGQESQKNQVQTLCGAYDRKWRRNVIMGRFPDREVAPVTSSFLPFCPASFWSRLRDSKGKEANEEPNVAK